LVVDTLPPVISTIDSGDGMVRVIGEGFHPQAVILIDNSPIPTTYISPTELSGVLPDQAEGVLGVSVLNPPDAGGGSNVVLFQLPNPVPELLSINPDDGISGNRIELTVRGSDFVENSVIFFDGRALATTFVDA